MAEYTLITSRDPFESRDSDQVMGLAADLRRDGHQVAVFLVQNGVFAARKCGLSATLTALLGQGVQVYADAFSLRERGIPQDRLEQGIQPKELDVIVDHLADGRRVIWH